MFEILIGVILLFIVIFVVLPLTGMFIGGMFELFFCHGFKEPPPSPFQKDMKNFQKYQNSYFEECARIKSANAWRRKKNHLPNPKFPEFADALQVYGSYQHPEKYGHPSTK